MQLTGRQRFQYHEVQENMAKYVALYECYGSGRARAATTVSFTSLMVRGFHRVVNHVHTWVHDSSRVRGGFG